MATATTESIPLSSVNGVMLTHVVEDPQAYVAGRLGRELTVTLGWGAVSRVDLLPASCSDPTCDADHGYEGTVAADDIALRVSAAADGEHALAEALDFAGDLSASPQPALTAAGHRMDGHPAPDLSAAGLPDVAPLGRDEPRASPASDGEAAFAFAPARRAVVVLLDGLGDDLLRRRGGHAPFAALAARRRHTGCRCGFPSTTATVDGQLRHRAAGRPRTGCSATRCSCRSEDRLLNELSWEDGPDPERWQPEPTVFERAAAAGLSVTRVGPGFFDGSGLTRAALRGGRFVAADLARRPGRRRRSPLSPPVLARSSTSTGATWTRSGMSTARVLGVGERARGGRPGAGPAGRPVAAATPR